MLTLSPSTSPLLLLLLLLLLWLLQLVQLKMIQRHQIRLESRAVASCNVAARSSGTKLVKGGTTRQCVSHLSRNWHRCRSSMCSSSSLVPS